MLRTTGSFNIFILLGNYSFLERRPIMPEETKTRLTNDQIRSFVLKNVPSVREVAPKEFEAMVAQGKVLADRLTGYIQGSIQAQEGIKAPGQEVGIFPFIAAIVSEEAVVEVGAVVAGVIAGDIVGNKSKVTGE
jgi:hypothetical protein